MGFIKEKSVNEAAELRVYMHVLPELLEGRVHVEPDSLEGLRSRRGSASERRGNNLKYFKAFDLKAKARIRP